MNKVIVYKNQDSTVSLFSPTLEYLKIKTIDKIAKDQFSNKVYKILDSSDPLLKDLDFLEFDNKNNLIVSEDKKKKYLDKEQIQKMKYEGKEYALNGKTYKISFTAEDQNALLAIKVGFEDFGLTETKFSFSNGTILPIKKEDFVELAIFFAYNRSQFFK